MGCHASPVLTSQKVNAGLKKLELAGLPSPSGPTQDEFVVASAAVPYVCTTQRSTIADLSSFTVHELKDFIRTLGGDPSQYLEKRELVDAVIQLDKSVSEAERYSQRSTSRNGQKCDSQGALGSTASQPAPPPPPPLCSTPPGQATRLRDRPIRGPSTPAAATSHPAATFPENCSSLLGPEEAALMVHEHCKNAMDAAATHLEEVWCQLLPEVAKMEFVASIVEAVKTRNVFELIGATLELKRAGTPVNRRIQQLAFEASVAEEAWLVRKSILDAVRCSDADEIELWAEQAKLAGEDVSVELAYVETLHLDSKDSTSRESTSSSSSARSLDPGYAEVGGDEGLGGIQPPSSNPSWHHSWHDADNADGVLYPGHEDTHGLREPNIVRSEAVAAAATAAAEHAQFGWAAARHPHSPQEHPSPEPPARHVRQRPHSAIPSRAAAPYSAIGSALGSGVRENLKQSHTTEEPGRYEKFWDGRSNDAPSSASAYTFTDKDLPREEQVRGTRYSDFWRTGQTSTSGAQAGFEAAFPRYAQYRARFEGGAAPSNGPASPCNGTSMTEDLPPPPPMPAQPAAAAHRRVPPSKPPPTAPASSSMDSTAFPDQAPRRPASACAGTSSSSATGRSKAGGRVRLLDFLQASSNQQAFSSSLGYESGKDTTTEMREGASHFSASASQPGPPPCRPAPPLPKRPPPQQPPPPPMPPQAHPPPQERPKATSSTPTRSASKGKEPASEQASSSWWKPWTRFASSFSSGGDVRSASSGRQPSSGFFSQPAGASPSAAGTGASSSSWWRSGRKTPKSSSSENSGSSPGAGRSSSRGAFDRFRESRDKAREEWEKQKQAKEEEERRQEREHWDYDNGTSREEQSSQKSKAGAKPTPKSYRNREENGTSASNGFADSGSKARGPPPRRKPAKTRDSHLELLGFAPGMQPTQEDLKKAYRVMAMRWHPDRPHNREKAAEATEKFQAAKDAYDYFMEEHKKR